MTQSRYNITAKEVILDRVQLRTTTDSRGRSVLGIAFSGVCVFEDSDGIETSVAVTRQAPIGEWTQEIQDLADGLYTALSKIIADKYGV